MRVLLVTPPMSNLNMPYPATAYLAGSLRARGVEVSQADWSLELAHRLFSPVGLERLARRLSDAGPRRRVLALISRLLARTGPKALARRAHAAGRPDRLARRRRFLADLERYTATVEPVLALLSGRDPRVGARVLSRGFLPEGRRLRRHFEGRGTDAPGFAALDDDDRASYVASLYLRELADVVRDVEPGFQLNAYADDVGRATDFDTVLRFLDRSRGGLIDGIVAELVGEALNGRPPDLLGLTVPFPGNLVGALRVAEAVRRVAPETRIALGGGHPNTHLRGVTDPRLFDFVDYLTLDDGERPLACLLEHLAGERGQDRLLRTFLRCEGRVVYCSGSTEADAAFADSATPTYAGLPVDRYLSVRFGPTALERIVGGCWSSLTLAHGCYWRRCAFCDIGLDYVGRYEPQRVDRLVDQIRRVVTETGRRDFHWVDEAAPPALLRALCERLLEQEIAIRWWGNIRFERAFRPELAALMARAGCVMVSGGLEVASDRLLRRIDKGVTVAQVARVARAFADHGIHVHAYLMYGFPSQTVQETVDSLELVRQLFAAGCLHSGYWHRLVVTEHSPIGKNPAEYGIRLTRPSRPAADRAFGSYPIPFREPGGADHAALGPGLQRALQAYQLGVGLGHPVERWFSVSVPGTSIAPDTIERALADRAGSA